MRECSFGSQFARLIALIQRLLRASSSGNQKSFTSLCLLYRLEQLIAQQLDGIADDHLLLPYKMAALRNHVILNEPHLLEARGLY